MLSLSPMIVHEYLIVIHNTFNNTFLYPVEETKTKCMCTNLREADTMCRKRIKDRTLHSCIKDVPSQDCPDRAFLVYFALPTGTTEAEHRIFLFSYVILSWRNLYINKKKSFRDKIYILIFLKISFICEFTSCFLFGPILLLFIETAGIY